jgi:hypothetical protein
MKKIILILLLLIILAIASVATWAYFAFLYTKPLNQAELAELTPDWSLVTHGNWSPWFTKPDGTTEWNPAASFNAWLATVPEEDKAWPVMVDVQYAGYELYDNLEVGKFPEDVEDWAAMLAMCELDESREMIDRLKEALQRPMMGAVLYGGDIPMPPRSDDDPKYTSDPAEFAAIKKHGIEGVQFIESTNPNPNLLSVALPALGKQRLMSALFRTYGIYELERGNPDGFVELVSISMDSAEIVPAIGSLVGQLVAIAIESHGNKTIAWALEHHPQAFTDEHLRTLDQLIARHQNRTFLWQGEAISFHDSIRRTVDDKGALKMTGARTLQGGGGSFEIPTNLPDAALHPSTQRVLYAYNHMLAQAQAESSSAWIPNGLTSSQIFDAQKSKMNQLGRRMFDMLSPVLDRSSERFRTHQQESADLRMTIAAHRHALRHGEMPASNKEIDKDLLPE